MLDCAVNCVLKRVWTCRQMSVTSELTLEVVYYNGQRAVCVCERVDRWAWRVNWRWKLCITTSNLLSVCVNVSIDEPDEWTDVGSCVLQRAACCLCVCERVDRWAWRVNWRWKSCITTSNLLSVCVNVSIDERDEWTDVGSCVLQRAACCLWASHWTCRSRRQTSAVGDQFRCQFLSYYIYSK